MDFSSPWQKRVSTGRGEIPTVSPVEKLTNRTKPEAHHERTSTAPRPYHEHTSSPRPYHECTSTAPEPYLDHITSVPRPHHECTSTAPRAVPRPHRTASVRVNHTVQEFTVPCHERVRVTAYLERTEVGTIVRAIMN